MRVGVMMGPERGRYATKVERSPSRRAVGGGGGAFLRLDSADSR